MQDGVSEQDMMNEVEQSLSGMGELEELVLGIIEDKHVSLRWHTM